MASASDNFMKMFPNHEHRRLHILYGVLAFVIAGASVVFYYKFKAPQQYLAPPPRAAESAPESFTAQERQAVLMDLQAKVSANSQLTDKDREKVLQELRKNISQNN